MMNFYISINGKEIIGHPIAEENLLLLYPNTDISTLSNEYAKFKKIDLNIDNPYKIYEKTIYIWDEDFVKEFHVIRDMTEKEKQQKISFVNDDNFKPFPSWVFNIDKCCFVPPVDHPNDGKNYIWNEEQQNWIEVTL